MKRFIINKNKQNNLSIKKINLSLFFSMFFLVVANIIVSDFTVSNIYTFIWHITILFLFLFFNYLYSKEHEESKNTVNNIIKTNNNLLITKKSYYHEVEKNNSLFNNLMI